MQELRMSDDQYYDFCMANADVRFERTAQGEIIIVPPAGGETAYRDTEVSIQLAIWAKRDGRGKAFGPSVEFFLPTGAAYSPDAAWVSNERLAQLTKEQKRKFPKVVSGVCGRGNVAQRPSEDRAKENGRLDGERR